MDSLDKILSERGEAVPTQDAQNTTQEAATTEANQSEQTEQRSEAQTEGSEPSKDGKSPPIGAIRNAERDKADKRYTAVLDGLRQEIRDRDAAWERRIGQVLEASHPQQRAEPPDFFANPEAAMQQFMRPVLQRIEGMSEAMSRQFAVRDHGRETVEQAYSVLSQRIGTDPAAQGEYQRIMRSGDPWGELVKWHKREAAIAEIGTDPDAFRAKVEAEILAKHGLGKDQQQAASAQNGAAPVMPSNFAAARNVGSRTGPAWSGPAPLDQIFAERRQATVFKR